MACSETDFLRYFKLKHSKYKIKFKDSKYKKKHLLTTEKIYKTTKFEKKIFCVSLIRIYLF